MWSVILMVVLFFFGSFTAQAEMVQVPLAPGQGPLAGLKALYQNNDKVVLALGSDPKFINFLPQLRHKDGSPVLPEETTRLKNGDLFLEIPDSDDDLIQVDAEVAKTYALAANKAWEESRAKIVVITPSTVPQAQPVVVARVEPTPATVIPAVASMPISSAPKPANTEKEFVNAEVTRIPEIPATNTQQPEPVVMDSISTEQGVVQNTQVNNAAFQIGPNNPYLASAFFPTSQEPQAEKPAEKASVPQPTNWMLWIGMAGLVALLLCGGWFAYVLWQNSKRAPKRFKRQPTLFVKMPVSQPGLQPENMKMVVNGLTRTYNAPKPVGLGSGTMRRMNLQSSASSMSSSAGPVSVIVHDQNREQAANEIAAKIVEYGMGNFVVNPGVHQNFAGRLQVMFAPGYEPASLKALHKALKEIFPDLKPPETIDHAAGQPYDAILVFN